MLSLEETLNSILLGNAPKKVKTGGPLLGNHHTLSRLLYLNSHQYRHVIGHEIHIPTTPLAQLQPVYILKFLVPSLQP